MYCCESKDTYNTKVTVSNCIDAHIVVILTDGFWSLIMPVKLRNDFTSLFPVISVFCMDLMNDSQSVGNLNHIKKYKFQVF